MVKIENEYGDRYTGKSSNAIYQGHYGQQIRRKSYKQKKPPSKTQLITRKRFTDAIAWIKTLNHNEINDIKHFYSILKERKPRSWPVNWYNFAKLLYIKKPVIKILDHYTCEYQVEHINILQIQELDQFGVITYDSGIMSDPPAGEILQKYSKVPETNTSQIKIITLPGIEYIKTIKTATGELRYFDKRFFDSRYFT